MNSNQVPLYKDIDEPGGAGKYKVSKTGEIISVQTGKPIFQKLNKNGYMYVKLHLNGKRVTRRVSRLVAIAFVPNPDNKPQVDHIDNNKLNNNADNLQWVTASENIQKYWDDNLHGRKGNLSGKITGLYLSHEARAILDTVDNKSKFVSDLIVASGSGTPIENTPLPENLEGVDLEMAREMNPQPAVGWKPGEPATISDLFTPEKNNSGATPPSSVVEDLFAAVAPDVKFVDVSPSGELPCCANEFKPCKHWVWDTNTGDGYVNILSGRRLEVE